MAAAARLLDGKDTPTPDQLKERIRFLNAKLCETQSQLYESQTDRLLDLVSKELKVQKSSVIVTRTTAAGLTCKYPNAPAPLCEMTTRIQITGLEREHPSECVIRLTWYMPRLEGRMDRMLQIDVSSGIDAYRVLTAPETWTLKFYAAQLEWLDEFGRYKYVGLDDETARLLGIP